jgi:hypothetical protein
MPGCKYEKPAPVEEPVEEEPSEDEGEATTPEEELPGGEAETPPGNDELDNGGEVLPPPGPGGEQNPVIPENTETNNRDKKDTRLPDLPQ